MGDRHMNRPVTLTDVARVAGVSVATASKALNGRDQVKDSTRARVQEAAARLSFSPNRLARGLLAGRSGTVGLLTSDLEGRFVIPILMGAEDAFGAGQVNVFLCDARGDHIREQHHLGGKPSLHAHGVTISDHRRSEPGFPQPERGMPIIYAFVTST